MFALYDQKSGLVSSHCGSIAGLIKYMDVLRWIFRYTADTPDRGMLKILTNINRKVTNFDELKVVEVLLPINSSRTDTLLRIICDWESPEIFAIRLSL